MKTVAQEILRHAPLGLWRPQIGDVVIQHGWLSHWFGTVNSVQGEQFTVIKSGLPLLLTQLDEIDQVKATEELTVARMLRSNRGGKYAAIQAVGGAVTWYV